MVREMFSSELAFSYCTSCTWRNVLMSFLQDDAHVKWISVLENRQLKSHRLIGHRVTRPMFYWRLFPILDVFIIFHYQIFHNNLDPSSAVQRRWLIETELQSWRVQLKLTEKTRSGRQLRCVTEAVTGRVKFVEKMWNSICFLMRPHGPKQQQQMKCIPLNVGFNKIHPVKVIKFVQWNNQFA